jgi:hypothetical protein
MTARESTGEIKVRQLDTWQIPKVLAGRLWASHTLL